MTDRLIEELEAKVDALIDHCRSLEMELATMRNKEAAWQTERTRLIEKNETARTRVEAMISHLKNLSTESEQRA
jgi:cell division protein ZapB